TRDDADAEEAYFLPLMGFVPCPACGGARLNRIARAVRFADRALPDVTAQSVEAAARFFHALVEAEEKAPALRARALLLSEIAQRLRFLEQVGLGYLTL